MTWRQDTPDRGLSDVWFAETGGGLVEDFSAGPLR